MKKFNPDYPFIIGLVDEIKNIPSEIQSPFPIVSVSEIEVLAFEEMSKKYTWDELSANSKPFFAKHFIQKYDKIIYIDATSVLYKSLDFYSEILDNQNIILIPQLIHAGIHHDEKQILNSGIYHAGVIGLQQSDETLKFLNWWSNNTQNKGFKDLCKGLNADQLWLEHVPALYDNVFIIKEEGLNIGYWNLPERNLEKLKAENNLVSFNYKGIKFSSEYHSELSKYSYKTLKNIKPTFGIPNPIDKKLSKTIAKNIRSINNIFDWLVDKIY